MLKQRLSSIAVTLLIASAAATPALASIITILDPGFESPALVCPPGALFYCSGGTPQPWTGGVVFQPGYNGTSIFTSVPEGVQTAALGNSIGVSSMSQVLSATLLANTVYTFGYFVGQRADFPFVSYSAEVDANGIALGSDSSGAPLPGQFVHRSFSFDSSATPGLVGTPLSIVFTTTNNSRGQANFDLVTLETVRSNVPEPGTFGLAGLAALALARLYRRKA